MSSKEGFRAVEICTTANAAGRRRDVAMSDSESAGAATA